jgi:hypothetical protein
VEEVYNHFKDSFVANEQIEYKAEGDNWQQGKILEVLPKNGRATGR